MEEEEELCIAKLFDVVKNKKKSNAKKKNKTKSEKAVTETVELKEAEAEDSARAVENNEDDDAVGVDDGDGDASSGGVRISQFDYSVDNYFHYLDTIARLCGENEDEDFEQSEIQRISSSVTFLRKWRDFQYPSRSIRFGYGPGSSEREDVNTINLPQFSSATVPTYDLQKENRLENAKSQESRDFVMYVGGPVWALDWCPQMHEKPDCSIKCEFIAVATHPPGSSYHKMGAPLTGRGVIQIWCLLNIREQNEDVFPLTEKRRKTTKKGGGTDDKSTQIKRPRGRPRKNPIQVPVDDMNCETQNVLPLDIKFPEDSAEFPTPDGNLEHNEKICSLTEKRENPPKKGGGKNDKSIQIKKPRGRPRKNSIEVPVDDMNCEAQNVLPLEVKFPEDSAELPTPDGNLEHNEVCSLTKKRKKRHEKGGVTNDKSTEINKPRLRPRKNPVKVPVDDINCETQDVLDFDVQFPEDSVEFYTTDGDSETSEEIFYTTTHKRKKGPKKNEATSEKSGQIQRPKGRSKQNSNEVIAVDTKCKNQSVQALAVQVLQDSAEFISPDLANGCCNKNASHSIPAEVTLPRVVSCLAHNGKVAWDVKWRPPNMSDSLFKYRMGYLAVLLGNGSLEVWEVPLPRVLRAIYIHGEGNDPRFIKLQPVFKCSLLKRGGLQSIPLTLEWSVTPPHDYLLVGCHDGTVALWKFSKNASSKCDDTKPILCFGADTVPIRAVAWAPFDGDPESSNIIVTAGHERLKFWDLRNPFRPLRNLHAAPRIIYSLDWLSKPSCIIMSFEDGAMRTISLSQAANDLPVSGKIYTGKKQPGLHTTIYSSFAIWSVQVSRITGMVAYCGADGTVFRFQLTSKAVEKDNSPRNRAPSFLCGSVTEEESTLIISTPVSHDPFPLKSCERSRRPAESFRELLSKTNNQIAKASNSDSRTLALSNGDGLDLESESEEALSSREKPKRPKLIHSNKEKPVENQGLICRDDVSTSTPGVDNEESNLSNIPEVFPSKMVALHKVRWNMNKGSERWLCSGGAGGVVRCQKIVLSDIDRQWALKR
ncbi:PREDICTED: uncharacterized protein LOC109336019 isoform X3 [Lupinus angustifolius]|uniref:uncharacterized protein LOC109336019 isoform X3 n=1 Tax=Lupinus angustifolius TaxID=3871 RepID=UPI00092F0CD7|nr:PREDICTED: uncharacterized protein LOC109336019 isoform X3 [Lupinus angustifolius]